jgi:hypothetical protein
MHLDRFSNFLLSLGIANPRLKITPVFPVGRMAQAEGTLLTQETLHDFDYSLLQCSETRVVAAGGVYSCPILAELEESFKPCQLYHPACVTCYQTGMTCKNL